ncbi:hypothetical protein O9566_18645, partial [Proteus mirabilis]|nr:hypothetical protein [Proteus mirabilis]
FNACLSHAQAPNQLCCPVGHNQLKSTAKSVAKWTWQNINGNGLSKAQTNRIRKRWAKYNAELLDIQGD